MKNFTKLFFILFTLSIGLQSNAQTLISSEFKQSRTKDQLILQFGVNPLLLNGVDLYKITYTTLDVKGVLDTASGLVIVPDNLSKIYPLLSFSQGTVGSKNDVPSKLQGGFELPMIMAGTGFVTVAADYLGLGDSRGFHPYVHADSEASASIDMLFAVREFAEQNDIFLNDQLFLSGYSQGGHAALATQRSLQLDYADDFTITASSPMSGPYDIYGAQRDFAIGDEEFFYPSFLPYVALGYQRAYGNMYNELVDFFKPEYVGMVENFRDGNINLTTLNIQILLKLNIDYGMAIPKYMLQDSIADQILNDPAHPISVALADNNLYNDWVPEAPTRFPYCGGDDQVHFTNSTIAADAFNANSAPDTKAELINPNFNHGQCVTPATTFTLLFFRQWQMIEDVNGIFDEDTLPVEIFPNPTNNVLNIEGLTNEGDLRLFDLTGKVVLTQKLNAGSNLIETVALQNGIYFVEIISEGKYRKEKIVIKK